MNLAVTPRQRTQSKARPKGILHPVAASLVVLGCFAGALLLVPKDEELVERLMVDGKHGRALDFVQGQEGHEALEQELIGVVESTSNLDTVTLPFGVDPGAALPEALNALSAGIKETSLTDLGPLAQAIASVRAMRDVTTSATLVAEHDQGSTALPDDARIEIYRTMGTRAVGEDNAPLAVGIYATFRGTGTVAPNSMLNEMIEASGYAGQPDSAVAVVEDHCKETGLEIADLPDNVRAKAVQMLRAANRPGDALDVLLAELQSQRNTSEGVRAETLRVAVETAGHSDRTTEMVPYLAAFVKNLPDTKRSWEETVALAKSGSLKLSQPYREYGKLLARYSEWTNQFPQAYDNYMRLALAGDREAFDRAADLYDDLNRQHEFMLLLQQVVPVEGEEKYTRLLAHLLGDSGLYAESEKWYRQWLSTHQKDVGAWLELGALLEEKANYEDALATFQGAAKLTENDPPAERLPLLKQIASLQIGLGNFEEPFRFYDRLKSNEHDATTLENYALLAEGSAQYLAYNNALFLRHKRLRKPTTEDFLGLARSFGMIGDPVNAGRTLKDGLRALPESKLLHIELANALNDEGDPAGAYRLLAKPLMRKSMQAVGIVIELASVLENYREAIQFLGRGIEKEFAFSPNIRLDLGHIYEGAGMLRDAERLYASVPDSPHTWPLLASARFKRGDYASAESFQKKHLSALSVPDPNAWMFLGDILRHQGKETDAERAYRRSLKLMESKLHEAP